MELSRNDYFTFLIALTYDGALLDASERACLDDLTQQFLNNRPIDTARFETAKAAVERVKAARRSQKLRHLPWADTWLNRDTPHNA